MSVCNRKCLRPRAGGMKFGEPAIAGGMKFGKPAIAGEMMPVLAPALLYNSFRGFLTISLDNAVFLE